MNPVTQPSSINEEFNRNTATNTVKVDAVRQVSIPVQLSNQSTVPVDPPSSYKAVLIGGSSDAVNPGESVVYGIRHNTSFYAADVEIVLFGVAKEVTTYQVTKYAEKQGIKVLNCELLTKWNKAYSITFKLTMKAHHADVALTNSVWPYGVGVRRFKRKKSTRITNKETQQSIHTPRQQKSKPAGIMKQVTEGIRYPVDMNLSNRYHLLYEEDVSHFVSEV